MALSAKKRIAILVAASLAPAIVLALLWRFTSMGELFTTERIAGWMATFRGYWWAPLAVVLAYIVASVVMFPRPILTIASVVVFGALKGFAYSMAGVVAAAVAAYYVGRLLREGTVKRLAGPKLDRISKHLRRKGLMAVVAIRLMPIAPFAVESVVAGALRIKLRDLVLGTIIGMLPGLLGTTVIGDQIAAAFSDTRSANAWIIGATLLALAAFMYAGHRWFRRIEARA